MEPTTSGAVTSTQRKSFRRLEARGKTASVVSIKHGAAADDDADLIHYPRHGSPAGSFTGHPDTNTPLPDPVDDGWVLPVDGRCPIEEAEARCILERPFLEGSVATHRIASSQRVADFDYLMAFQDHNAVNQLRVTLFPALAHSIEALLAAAVEESVQRECREVATHASQRAAARISARIDRRPVEEQVREAVEQYTERATRSATPASHPDAATLAYLGFSHRCKPLLPLGSMPHDLKVRGVHPVRFLAEELKKRACGRDHLFARDFGGHRASSSEPNDGDSSVNGGQGGASSGHSSTDVNE